MTRSPSTETLRLRGLDYHLRLWGPANAPALICLHGLLDTGASFAPMVEALTGDWRVIAPDWRGHGMSDDAAPGGYWFPDYVADLDQLVDRVSPDAPVRLVAHSMGATAASLYAGLRPGRVSHLVCLDALNVPARRSEQVPQRYASWLDAQRTPPTARRYAGIDALAERIARRYPELSAAQIHRLAQEWSYPVDGGIALRNDPWHAVASPYGFNPDHAMAVWREVTAWVYCLDGGESPAHRWIDADEMRRRRGAFANLRHEVLAGCAHMLHLEQPAEVARRVEGFVQR